MSKPFCSGLHQNALISTASFAYQGTGCLVPHLCPVEKVFKLSEEGNLTLGKETINLKRAAKFLTRKNPASAILKAAWSGHMVLPFSKLTTNQKASSV